MFTCPENDIHSIYLDDELPESFKAEYEAHIASCPKCKAKLEQMKKTHEAFQADSASITLDQAFLDQSFERLQSRMRYAKTVSASNENTSKKNVIKFPNLQKYLPVAAAAAVAFAISLPIKISGNKAVNEANVAMAQLQTIKRNTNFNLSPVQMVSERSSVAYPITLVSQNANSTSTYTLNAFNPGVETVTASVMQFGTRNRGQEFSELLADDFFMPEFTRAQENSTLQVYMPTYVDISALNK